MLALICALSVAGTLDGSAAAKLRRRLVALEDSVLADAEGLAFDDYRALQSNALRALLRGDVDLAQFRQNKVVNDAVPTEVHDVANAALLDRIVRASPRYAERYARLSVDPMVGGPALRMPNNPQATPKSVQLTFMTALFESTIRGDINDSDLIVEFGGGYGSLAHGIFELGFKGTYIIFDLPVASALQEYFLTLSGVPVAKGLEPLSAAHAGGGHARCVTTLDELAGAIALHRSGAPRDALRMFLGLWSFSESPVPLRDAIAPMLRGFDRFFVGYQPEFHDVTNRDYFDGFKRALDSADERARRKESYIAWTGGETPLVIEAKGSRFLIGTRVGANSLPYATTPPPKISAQSVDISCADAARAAEDVARYIEGARDVLRAHDTAAGTLAATLRSTAVQMCAAPHRPPSALITFTLSSEL